MSYTTVDLLDSIKRRAVAPANQRTFEPVELLAIADEETRGVVVPSLVRLREDYFVNYIDIPLVGSQAEYFIPSRSSGMTVRHVQLIGADGNPKSLKRTEIERVSNYGTGYPDSFHFRSNSIVLRPVPSSASSTLRVFFSLAPSRLVETSESAVISVIDTATNVVTVSSIPSTWAAGNTFDLTKQDGGQEPLAIDLTSTDISSNVITLPSLPTGLRVGDYVSLAGETALVQLPVEYCDVLAQAVACRVLGDTNQSGADRAEKKLDKLILIAEKQCKQRAIGESQIIVNNLWT